MLFAVSTIHFESTICTFIGCFIEHCFLRGSCVHWYGSLCNVLWFVFVGVFYCIEFVCIACCCVVYDTTKTGFVVFVLALSGKVDGVGCCGFAVNTACDKVFPCSFCHVPLFATIDQVSKRGFLIGFLGLLRCQCSMVPYPIYCGCLQGLFSHTQGIGAFGTMSHA